jgi:two-component system, NarL family, sensor histidine kinase UhpB
LTAIHIDASAIRNAKHLGDTHESAEAIDTVARQMMDMVHTMLQRLRPGVLEELGLAVALQELVDLWLQRHPDISSTVHISKQLENVEESVAITAYRIVQECLTNIARHAHARQIAITVSCSGEDLTLLIKDDGVGFNTGSTPGGFGLAGMRERVEGLGGTFMITSKPADHPSDSGVLIAVRLPFLAQDVL